MFEEHNQARPGRIFIGRFGARSLDVVFLSPAMDQDGRADDPDYGHRPSHERHDAGVGPRKAQRQTGEKGKVHDVVSPEIDFRPPGAFLEADARQFAVAAIQDGMQPDQRRPGQVRRLLMDEKKAVPTRPTTQLKSVIMLGETGVSSRTREMASDRCRSK